MTEVTKGLWMRWCNLGAYIITNTVYIYIYILFFFVFLGGSSYDNDGILDPNTLFY